MLDDEGEKEAGLSAFIIRHNSAFIVSSSIPSRSPDIINSSKPVASFATGEGLLFCYTE